jgi:hypothetical protein
MNTEKSRVVKQKAVLNKTGFCQQTNGKS